MLLTLDGAMAKEASLPEELLGDKIRFRQVLINLTKYTLKLTSQGKISMKTCYLENDSMIEVHI
jgi:signal transduction histidine kinase